MPSYLPLQVASDERVQAGQQPILAAAAALSVLYCGCCVQPLHCGGWSRDGGMS